MSVRFAPAALVGSLVLLVGAACGAAGGGPTGPAAAPPPRVGAIKIDPTSGPIGTLFTLTATGLKEGEAVAFEITFPGEGKAYPGAAIAVPADGTASTTYRATTANQPGDYAVRLTGPPGALAEGRFTVTDGPPVTTALPGEGDTSSTGPATSGKTGTTGRSGRTSTTAKGGSTTSSSPKGSSTTPTTRRSSTTSASTMRSPTTTR
jgi:hypothetical protein